MLPQIGAALIGGGSSLLGSVMNLFGQKSANKQNAKNVAATNQTNLQIAREANEANRQNLEYQNQWNLDQWNRENVYNSAGAQVARYRAAGLNPNLMMSGGDSGIASSITSETGSPANVASMQSATVQPLDYGSIANSLTGALNSYYESLNQQERIKKQRIENDVASTDREFHRTQVILGIHKQVAELTALHDAHKLSDTNYRKAMNDLSVQLSQLDDLKQRAAKENKLLDSQANALDEGVNRAFEASQREDFIARVNSMLARSSIDLNSKQGKLLMESAIKVHDENKREHKIHLLDIKLKKLDKTYKSLVNRGLRHDIAINVALDAMNVEHEEIKDKSLINRLVERAFGIGFRDIGTALRGLFK